MMCLGCIEEYDIISTINDMTCCAHQNNELDIIVLIQWVQLYKILNNK